MILFVAFGTHPDGTIWQESRYQFESILEASNEAEKVSDVEGYYVLHTRYSSDVDDDITDIVYEENTEGYSIQCSPFIRVSKVEVTK
jgi:hypothetical protein